MLASYSTVKMQSDSRLQTLLLRRSMWFAVFVLAIGILVLAGWIWNIGFLVRPAPRMTAMNPFTALTFLCAAASFLCLSGSTAATRKRLGTILAVLVLLVGVWRITGYLPDISPQRMAAQTAFCFLPCGLSLLFFNPAKRGASAVSQYLALLVVFVNLFSLVGYLYRVQAFYAPFTYVPISAYTCVCFLFLSVAILLAQAGQGFMKELAGSNAGSIVGRSLLPYVVLLPILLGYLRLFAYWKGLISTEFGLAILVSAIILAFSVIIWFVTRLLNRRDRLNQAAERKLLESEDRFRLIVDSVKDYAIFMLDPNGNIISWNEGAERIKGYRKDEILGRNMEVFYTPDEIKRDEPRFNLQQTETFGRFEQEGERIRKDGSIFWANIVFTALRDANGQLLGFAKVTRDITERKRAEEQIAYLARLMEDNSDAIFSTDSSFQIRTWNKAAELLFGYSFAEVRGKSAGDILRTQMDGDMIDSIREKMLGTGYWKGEVYYLTKTGTRLTILLSTTSVRNAVGQPDGFVMACRDFTERKKLELQLKHFNNELEEQVRKKTAELTDYKYALDQSSIVSITDIHGIIKYVNDNFCRISGYTHAELIGQRHRLVSSGHHPDAFFRKMWQTISGGGVWKGEIRNAAKDGTIYWVEMTIIPFLDANRKPYEYIALDSDITERKKAEELLSISYQDIRALASHLQDVREEERAGIAREIHDELGQQLTGLKMDVSWISKRKIVEGDDELKQKTLSTISLLDTTIKTVRRIATDLRPSILDDLGLIAAIEWQSQEFERRSGIVTEFSSTITEFRHSSAIAIGLFRICQESLTNIARHAAAGRVRVSLQEEENEYILLKIEDDGKGFEMQKIGNKKTLGLLGMKERTLMMGGEFRIESKPGKGTTLFVTVPVPDTKLNPT